ncbi:MAG TPA: NPCBM/NEW2 domain-containing protein [Phycisphaerae bacterium]|nr:NPCBM/NEW2 domain-containing protein [Phycisphaerae bacterium]HRR86252.1 NPCBM/NEW2 domain-containing protein [Phycisphaerae bacterium]
MTILAVAFVIAVSPSASPVQALMLDGQVFEGQWAGPGQEGEIRLQTGGAARTVRIDELLSLRWQTAHTAAASQSQPLPLVIHLRDGGRISARVLGSDSGGLELETKWTKSLIVPLSLMAAMCSCGDQRHDLSAAFEQTLADKKPDEDQLLVVRNNRVTTLKGTLESLGADGGSFRWRDRSVPFAAQEAFAVVMATGQSTPPLAQALCSLRDGCTWAGQIVGIEADLLRLRLSMGTVLSLPIEQMSEIRFRSDRVLFLSDLTPAKYEFEPFGATRWPYRVNRAVSNQPMRIGEQSFDRGIGVHSRSVLTYDVPEGFVRLAAMIGIDEAVGDRGNVIFRVLADGKEVFNSGPVTGRDAARPLLATIENARQIQLIVEFGDDIDIGDQADWAEVRLIR